MEFEINMTEMPLGKLSTQNIQKGTKYILYGFLLFLSLIVMIIWKNIDNLAPLFFSFSVQVLRHWLRFKICWVTTVTVTLQSKRACLLQPVIDFSHLYLPYILTSLEMNLTLRPKYVMFSFILACHLKMIISCFSIFILFYREIHFCPYKTSNWI